MIQKHKTWDIIDSSKIQEYMGCPRKYFYRYMLGWETQGRNIHLIFGEAWHRAIEVLMRKGYTGEAIKEGMMKFEEYYRRYYEEYEDENNRPKNVEHALEALIEYCVQYQDIDKFEVLYTEVHGTIPLDDKRMIVGRIDSICKDERGYFSLEHKTGSYKTSTWAEQWTLKTQIGTYNHAMMCMFPPEEVYGVIINGVFFYKTKTEFLRAPIRKLKSSMQIWLDNTLYYYKQIEKDMALMLEEENYEMDSETMKSFPMNPESCTKWNRICRYSDFCNTWSNPLQRCDEMPLDFEKVWWNPAESEKDVTRMEGGKIIK